MFYKLRLKAAFASIGVPPDLVPEQLINLGAEQGQQNRANPAEAMLIMLAQMPVDLQLTAKDDLVRALRAGPVHLNSFPGFLSEVSAIVQAAAGSCSGVK
jgi:hypothetical protein